MDRGEECKDSKKIWKKFFEAVKNMELFEGAGILSPPPWPEMYMLEMTLLIIP